MKPTDSCRPLDGIGAPEGAKFGLGRIFLIGRIFETLTASEIARVLACHGEAEAEDGEPVVTRQTAGGLGLVVITRAERDLTSVVALSP